MAYATYTTKAIVCGSKDSYTSDRSYLLFTREAGMLWATARSVREEKSKQRFALQDFSIIRVSLVKGRSGWRIGSVEANGNPFLGARSRSERAYVNGIVGLLRRYIHGEQQMHDVYDDVEQALSNKVLVETADATTLTFTTRLLYTLGYILKNSANQNLIEPIDLSEAIKSLDSGVYPDLQKAIQRAHETSQL